MRPGARRRELALGLLFILALGAPWLASADPDPDKGPPVPAQDPAAVHGAEKPSAAPDGVAPPVEPISADNWTERVGFAPNLAEVPKYAPGQTVKASNHERYAAWLSPGLTLLIDRYKLKLTTVAYERIHPSLGYIEATNAYLGQASIDFEKTDPRQTALKGYTAGLPFPRPFDEPDPVKAGRMIAYNMRYKYTGDDGGFHYGVYWISAEDGIEKTEEWRSRFISRGVNRTDIEPIPAIPEFVKAGVASRSLTWAVFPQDKRGFASLYSRYAEPKDIQGWLYVPTMRRVMRYAFGTRGEAWNNTDLLYEDVGGYMGYAEWMNWRLVERRTMLLPMHAGLGTGKKARDKSFDFNTWPHWNPKMNWEPRAVYVVEATPRLEDYPYARMLLYVDAETNAVVFKEAFDKKGTLWKVILNAFNASPDMDEMPLSIATALAIDVQAEHASVFPSYTVEVNVGYDPRFFTEANLRKMGK